MQRRGAHGDRIRPARATGAAVSGLIAFIALIAIALGIYGVLARDLAMCGHELAIRQALGATPWRLGRFLLLPYTLWLGLGVAGGCLIARALSPLVATGAVQHGQGSALLGSVFFIAAIVGMSAVPALIALFRQDSVTLLK
jgi:hypothetical protein